MKTKIYYHHTDSGGVVYYAKYLEFLEEARSEFLEEKGISVKELAQGGTLFVVARQEIDYKCPGFYGDTLDAQVCAVKVGRVRIEFDCQITNQNKQILSEAKTILVCVDQGLRPKAIPEDVLKKIS